MNVTEGRAESGKRPLKVSRDLGRALPKWMPDGALLCDV